MQTKLYKRDDARRMAKMLCTIRAEQGEIALADISTRRMKTLPANVLAVFAARPACFRRDVRLTNVQPTSVTFRIGGAF